MKIKLLSVIILVLAVSCGEPGAHTLSESERLIEVVDQNGIKTISYAQNGEKIETTKTFEQARLEFERTRATELAADMRPDMALRDGTARNLLSTSEEGAFQTIVMDKCSFCHKVNGVDPRIPRSTAQVDFARIRTAIAGRLGGYDKAAEYLDSIVGDPATHPLPPFMRNDPGTLESVSPLIALEPEEKAIFLRRLTNSWDAPETKELASPESFGTIFGAAQFGGDADWFSLLSPKAGKYEVALVADGNFELVVDTTAAKVTKIDARRFEIDVLENEGIIVGVSASARVGAMYEVNFTEK
ncbi:MAG: hypothetical protein NUW37_01370 [Planctomycetes bacterium]|nr:hypothetical protein [Planctomycetota bacterium]